MRIEYKYCPNLTIIDTPGVRGWCGSGWNRRRTGAKRACCAQRTAAYCSCSPPDSLAARLVPVQVSSPLRPASVTPRCRTAPSRWAGGRLFGRACMRAWEEEQPGLLGSLAPSAASLMPATS